MSTVWKSGIRNAVAFSVHPAQGAPMPIGQAPGISLKCRVEQGA